MRRINSANSKEKEIANFSSRQWRGLKSANPSARGRIEIAKFISRPHRPPHTHPDKSTLFLTGRTYAGLSWLYPEPTKRYLYEKLTEILPKYKLELDAHVICNNHYHLLLQVSKGNLVPKFVRHLHGASARFIRSEVLAQFIARIEHGQILTREVTPWDRRQAKRNRAFQRALERRMNSANSKKKEIAHFNARNERRINSANSKEKEIANFSSRSFITDPQVLALLSSKEPPIWYQYTDHVIRDEKDYWMHFNYIHQNSVKHGYVEEMAQYHFSSYNRYLKGKGKKWLADCFARYPIVDFMPKGSAD